MALVMDLNQRDRDAVVDEAIFRSWDWWPDCPDGRLHHAVFCQLLKDLAQYASHKSAMADLCAIDDHWWLEYASVNLRDIKTHLTSWAFIGKGKEMPAELNPNAGKAWCSGCKTHLPVDQFRAVKAAASGISPYCLVCARKEGRKAWARKKTRQAKEV